MSIAERTPGYMSGSLTGLSPEERGPVLGFYEDIAQLADRHGIDLYLPHQHTDPVKDADVTPRQVFEMDKARVLGSELMITELSRDSLGVGAEIAYCDVNNIPMIFLSSPEAYKRIRGIRIDRKSLEVEVLKAVILYETHEEALEKLDGFLSGNWESIKRGEFAERVII
jgi:hypothetical protein